MSREEFENWVMAHNFLYKQDIKKWINENNYRNLFTMDWTELMSLVTKIERVGLEGQSVDVLICREKCEIHLYNDDESEPVKQWDAYGDDKIEAIYKACLMFIKWYNQQ